LRMSGCDSFDLLAVCSDACETFELGSDELTETCTGKFDAFATESATSLWLKAW